MRTYLKKCRHGEFLLLHGDMISEYVNLYGEWCEGEVELFAKLLNPNAVVVEVGANMGMHTVPLAKICHTGKVVCFEPQRVIFQVLCANLALNNLTHVHAVHAAVGEANKQVLIEQANYEAVWNYGAFSVEKGFSSEENFKGSVNHESVELLALDSSALIQNNARIDFLKIDTEGFETQVLEGARNTLAKFRPLLFVENNKEAASAQLLALVRELGYKPYWYCSLRHRANNFNQAFWSIKGSDVNILCIPNERIGKVDLLEATKFSDVMDGTAPYY